MAHELAIALQHAGGVGQRCALEESHVDVRGEDVDIPEGYVSQTGCGAAIVQEFAHFIAALLHHLKPLFGVGSQLTAMLLESAIYGGVVFGSTVESQQFGLHRLSGSAGSILWSFAWAQTMPSVVDRRAWMAAQTSALINILTVIFNRHMISALTQPGLKPTSKFVREGESNHEINILEVLCSSTVCNADDSSAAPHD